MESNSTYNESDISCVLPHEISENQWLFYHAFTWWLEGFGSLLIGSMGIIFNITTIFVLLGSELAASFFNWLLVSLAVFDSLFLLNGILEAFRNHLGLGTNLHDYIFVVFLFPFRSIVMCCSTYATVTLALERYNALVRPISNHASGMRSSGKQSIKDYFALHWLRLLKYIGPIIVMATIFYIPKRLEIELVKHECPKNSTNDTQEDCNGFEYEIQLTKLRSNTHYILWYQNISNLLITAIIPLVSLIYLNLNVYLKFKEYLQRQPVMTAAATSRLSIKHAQEKVRKREKDMVQQTMILFAIVILFGVFHILRIILNIEEFASHDNNQMASSIGCDWLQYWTIIAAPVSHILLQINSSINFFIYCFFNKGFRDELLNRLSSIRALFKMKREVAGLTANAENKHRNTTVPDTKMTTLLTTNPQEARENGNVDNGEAIELNSIRTVICE